MSLRDGLVAWAHTRWAAMHPPVEPLSAEDVARAQAEALLIEERLAALEQAAARRAAQPYYEPPRKLP